MKYILCVSLLCIESYAEYEKGKIDMHGGKESAIYNKKSNFSQSGFGRSLLVDKNTTREKTSKKREPQKK